jgi:glucokinase
MTYILAGDIGGTNCRLALASVNKTQTMIMLQKTLPSGDYASFAALLADFLDYIQEHGFTKPELAAFGVAGPVSQERAKLTNLPWIIDAASLQQQFAFAKVRVLNDFEALAYAYPALGPEDIALVKDGVKNEDAPVGFLGAGTGLGAAVYFPRWHFVQPTESGHLDFAPCDEEQERLLRYLRVIYGHVSYERIVSGPGLAMLYQFLAQEQSLTVQPLSPPEVTDLALTGEPLAKRALELFIRIYGQKAGNVALAHLCHGGMLLAGGIAPKIVDWLKGPLFVTAFLDKGRMRPVLETMPIHVITDTDAGLKGAMFALFERHAWAD